MEPYPESDREDASLNDTSNDEKALKDILKDGKGISVGEVGRSATVVFESAVESTSVYVDDQGNVSISRGALPNPNIAVEGDHDVLCAILQMREPTFAAPGSVRITVNFGTIRDFIVEISKGQEMVNPLKELYV